MARPGEIAAVYAAGVVQGVALVTFPAVGAILTSPAHYALSSEAYGAIFLPQAVTAVAASLAGAGLGRRLGVKRLYLLGLAADLVAMSLLVLSQFAGGHREAYGLLLAATAALGTGFGLTVPALNTLAAAFFPHRVDAAVLVLNALLGLGTALAPVFAALFVGLGFWWGLPLLVAALGAALLVLSRPLPLATSAGSVAGAVSRGAVPARFWLFAAFALLYGIVETMNGNWATLYMTRDLGSGAALASAALTVFWATVTAGRVLLATVERWVPARVAYRCLPLLGALALILAACLPRGAEGLGILTFALAGLGCSALLPLTISLAHQELTGMAASVAGSLIACYQLGYGIAAFGVGPLHDTAGLGLGAIFGGTAGVALALAGLALAVTGHAGAPATAALRRPRLG